MAAVRRTAAARAAAAGAAPAPEFDPQIESARAIAAEIVSGERTMPRTLDEIVRETEAVLEAMDVLAQTAEIATEARQDTSELVDAWEACEAHLAALDSTEHRKIDGYAQVVARMKAIEDMCSKEERRLAARRRACERKREQLKASVIDAAARKGVRRFDGDLSYVTIQATPASLRYEERVILECLPQYVRMVPTVDTEALRAELKNGGRITVDGQDAAVMMPGVTAVWR